MPSSSATRACRRLTVGSSPKTSSPTSARAIASRIAGVGRVTVSERRSIMRVLPLELGLEAVEEPFFGVRRPVLDGDDDARRVARLGDLRRAAVGLLAVRQLEQDVARLGILLEDGELLVDAEEAQ